MSVNAPTKVTLSDRAPDARHVAEGAALLGTDGPDPASHFVQFYDNDEFLVEAVADFLGAGLACGEAVVAILTQDHREGLTARLASKGVDIEGACAAGRLALVDAHEMLASFMVGSMPRWARFESAISSVLDASLAAAPAMRVRAYGEMVDVLWRGGNTKAAIRLEEMWNELQERRSFSLMCAYVMASFYKEPLGLQRVCAAHTHVVPAGSGRARGDDGVDESEACSTAQPQYAHRLAAEIVQRREVEQALRESLRELRRTEVELRQSQRSLKDFVENATVGLHSVSADGTILWANRAALELLGYTEDEYIGRAIADIHVDATVIADLLSRLVRGEELRDRVASLRAKDGSIKHVLVSSNGYFENGELVHTRCFVRDVTERMHAEEALRENERQLQTITDALPVLVTYVDTGRRYRFANATYERWFGIPRAEILGKHVREVLGDAAYEHLRGHVDAALSGERVTFETRAPYRNGGARVVEATYIPHLGPAGDVRGYIALVADVSERRRLERVREEAARRTERLMKITAAIADAVTPEQVLEAVVNQVATALDASSAGLWLVQDDERTATLARSFGYSEAARLPLAEVPLDAPALFPAIDAIRRGEPVWLASQEELLERYPHLAPIVTPGRSYQIACLPIVVRGRALGSLGFTFDDAGPMGDDERTFLMIVARHSGQALERLRLLEAERRSRQHAEATARRMALLSHASRAFSEAAHDLPALLQIMVEEVAREHADACGVLLAAGGDTLDLAALHHRDPAVVAELRSAVQVAPVKLGEGIVGRVALTGQPVFLPDVDAAILLAVVEPARRALVERQLPRSLIVVPLRVRGEIIGVLGAARQPGSGAFDEQDQTLLEELAERAAMAFESSRLQRDNQQGRLRAELLCGLAGAVIGAERIEEILAAALDAIERALGASRSSILAFDADGVMRFKAWRGLSDGYRGAVEGHSPWTRDARAPEPILVRDVESDPAMGPYLPLFRRERIGALGFIPLVAAGRLLGKFMVYYDAPHELSAHELDMARAIANHVAATLARFEAVAELQQTVRFNEMFTGILGHDLRNPLGAIMTTAQFALRRGGSDKLSARILRSGERMARMIDQLLDFTRVRVGGGIPLDPREVDLVPVLRQVHEELDGANPEWTLRLEEVGDTCGTWDADRLTQVFSNLVANAMRHGVPEHGVEVRVDGSASDRVRVEVHNMGAIAPALLPKLFEPMAGGDARRDRSQGLGLGLYISRQILAAHGGSIEVRSVEATGTTFTVSLPRFATRAGPGRKRRSTA